MSSEISDLLRAVMAQACTGTRTLQKIEQLEQFVPLIYSNILYADERHRQRTEITSCWPGSNGRHEMTACIVVKLHHGGSGEQVRGGLPTRANWGSPPQH